MKDEAAGAAEVRLRDEPRVGRVATPPRALRDAIGDVGPACLLGVILMMPIPGPVQGASAGLLMVVVRRPQPVLLASVPVIALRSGSLTTVGLLAGLVVASSLLTLASGQARRPAKPALALPAFALWITFSFVLADNHAAGAPTIVDLAQPLAGLLIATSAAYSPPRLQDIALISLVSAAVISVVILRAPSAAGDRTVALGLNSNYLAALVALLIAASLIEAPRWQLMAALVVSPLGLLALARTQSRAGVIALGLALVVRFLVSGRSGTIDKRRLAAALVAAIVLWFVAPRVSTFVQQSFLGSRVASDFASSDYERGVAAGAAVTVFLEHPWFGVGYGDFASVATGLPGVHTYLNSHDEYVRFAAELGAPGLALFILPLVVAFWRMHGTAKATLISPLSCFLVSIAFGNDLASIATSSLFWLVMGVCLSGQPPFQTKPRLRAESITHTPRGSRWLAG